MRTVRRLFYRDIVSSVAFVALAFLSLFFFIDFVDELAEVGTRGYTTLHAALYSLLLLPGHLYELSPIAVLIGTIYALSRLAQSSEYTILRTGGLGPGRALSLLASLGLMFALFTWVVGDYLAPLAERQATQLQARFKGGIRVGGSGAWMKDRATTPDGVRSYSVNVGTARGGTQLEDVRIFEFDADGRLLGRMSAARARGRHAAEQPAVGVELEDAHVLELRAAARGADVHRIAAHAVRGGGAVLHPGARAADTDAAFESRLQLRGLALGQRREVVADDPGEQREHQPQARQQRQRAARSEPAGAQDRVLGRLRQPRQRVDRADQHRDRRQLVQVTRQQQQRVERRVQRGVAARADLGELVDEVDEEEQRQEGQRHEGDGRDDVTVEQAPHRPHAAAPARRGRCQRRLPCSRHHSIATASTKVPPWAPTRAAPIVVLPDATQAWVRLMTL